MPSQIKSPIFEHKSATKRLDTDVASAVSTKTKTA